jgi:hypothetical protein
MTAPETGQLFLSAALVFTTYRLNRTLDRLETAVDIHATKLTRLETLCAERHKRGGASTAVTAFLLLAVFSAIISCAPLIQTGGSQFVRTAENAPQSPPMPPGGVPVATATETVTGGRADAKANALQPVRVPGVALPTPALSRPPIILAAKQATVAAAGDNAAQDTAPRNTATETQPVSRLLYVAKMVAYVVAGVFIVALLAFVAYCFFTPKTVWDLFKPKA